MKKIVLALILWFGIVGCGLTEKEKKQYQWEIQKSISMQEFLLREGLNKKTIKRIRHYTILMQLSEKNEYKGGDLFIKTDKENKVSK